MCLIQLNKRLLKGTVLLFLLSSSVNVAANDPPSWVKIPGTYGHSGNRSGSPPPDGDVWYADDRSVWNIRGVLNLTIVDSGALSWHVATSCDPKNRRYKQMNFTVLGTGHQGEWQPVGSDARRNNAFKFICSRYGKVKHGEGYQ